jgi:hypothetical protein
MARQWRNLQMFKRAGRGHAADGIAGTKAGECALLCTACPQPGKNLLRDGSWKVVPCERRFLYALFLALDANFRMKRKDVSSEADDPSLGDGVAFSRKWMNICGTWSRTGIWSRRFVSCTVSCVWTDVSFVEKHLCCSRCGGRA